jgi:hypothetical protein
MSVTRIVLYTTVPVLALIGGLMLLLSMDAPAPLFGLYLSIGAWMVMLALAALPYLIYRQWQIRQRDGE